MEPTDPFRYCEDSGCTHDLSMGVLIADLLDRDGPHPVRRVGVFGSSEPSLDEAA